MTFESGSMCVVCVCVHASVRLVGSSSMTILPSFFHFEHHHALTNLLLKKVASNQIRIPAELKHLSKRRKRK